MRRARSRLGEDRYRLFLRFSMRSARSTQLTMRRPKASVIRRSRSSLSTSPWAVAGRAPAPKCPRRNGGSVRPQSTGCLIKCWTYSSAGDVGDVGTAKTALVTCSGTIPKRRRYQRPSKASGTVSFLAAFIRPERRLYVFQRQTEELAGNPIERALRADQVKCPVNMLDPTARLLRQPPARMIPAQRTGPLILHRDLAAHRYRH